MSECDILSDYFLKFFNPLSVPAQVSSLCIWIFQGNVFLEVQYTGGQTDRIIYIVFVQSVGNV